MNLARCHHCNKPKSISHHDDIIIFCDSVCLNSYVCEQTAESKDEMLQAIGYANNRELRNELEEEVEK